MQHGCDNTKEDSNVLVVTGTLEILPWTLQTLGGTFTKKCFGIKMKDKTPVYLTLECEGEKSPTLEALRGGAYCEAVGRFEKGATYIMLKAAKIYEVPRPEKKKSKKS